MDWKFSQTGCGKGRGGKYGKTTDDCGLLMEEKRRDEEKKEKRKEGKKRGKKRRGGEKTKIREE